MHLLAANAKMAMKPNTQVNDFMFRRNKIGSTLSRSLTARRRRDGLAASHHWIVQVLGLPDHRAMDAIPPAGMVEEQEFLDRAGMHLAVFGQLHGRLGKTVGLACGIQAERVGLGFHAVGDGVGHRRHEEHEDGEQCREQWQPGHVADTAQSPAFAPAAFGPPEAPAHEREGEHDDEAEEHDALVDVVQHVVAHLVAEHGLDLIGRTALEQVVVEADAGGTEHAADIRAYALALARGIEPVHVGGGNAIGPRHRQDLRE